MPEFVHNPKPVDRKTANKPIYLVIVHDYSDENEFTYIASINVTFGNSHLDIIGKLITTKREIKKLRENPTYDLITSKDGKDIHWIVPNHEVVRLEVVSHKVSQQQLQGEKI